MAEAYYSLKVTIGGLGNKKYLSLLDSASAGVDGGIGWNFEFDPDKPPAGTPTLRQFRQSLTTGKIPSSSHIENFGRWLFDCAFGGTNNVSYRTAIATAQIQDRRLRICMNLLASDLIDVPWEYLHDGGGFVIERGPDIVRLLDGLMITESSFAPVQKLLIAVADPVKAPDQFVPFNGEVHLRTVTSTLEQIGGLTITPIMHATREDLRQAFQKNKFDAFYFIGHGIHLQDGGGYLVCEDQGAPDLLAADVLAAWIRESKSLRFVYLNSCSTAVTSASNPIQGVAQRLMRDGRVAAVAAMQVDIQQTAAQRVAQTFFEHLSDGKSPEHAMLLSRHTTGDLQSFGIPVLYSTLDAPAQFEKNRLRAFLGLTEQSSCALLMPEWTMGLPGDDGDEANRKGLDGDKYYYRGPTFATADISSAWRIADLLAKVLPHEKLQILSNENVSAAEATHFFVFGSKSSDALPGVLELFDGEFIFDYQPGDAPGYWVIRDKKFGNCYEVIAPHHLSNRKYHNTTDYGVIQKFTAESSNRVYFLIAGLGSRATEGCGYYLRDHWPELLHEFGAKDFAILVAFTKGLGPQGGQRKIREAGNRPCEEIPKRIVANG